MRADSVNRWLTLGANFGVLIGIILLLVELDQNRDMMRAQTRSEIARGLVDLLSVPAGNIQLADSIARANRGEELTPAEVQMLYAFNESVFRYWENSHYQYRQGLYDEVEFSKHLDVMADVIMNNRSALEFWCERRAFFSTPFVSEIDQLLGTHAEGCVTERN